MVARSSLRVLVVEGDPDTRVNLCDILDLDGHAVEPVAEVGVLWQRADWSDVSVVVLDDQVAEDPAEDVLPRLKRLAPEVPVIVVTSHLDQEGPIVALRGGGYEYLLKPINPDALRSLVGGLCERRDAERRLAESEARQRALLNAIPDMMLRIGRDGTIRDRLAPRDSSRQPHAEPMLGAHVQTAPLPKVVVERLQQGIERALERDEVQSLEYYLPTPQGKRHYEARIVKSAADEVVTIVRDMTSQKRAEERALQAERLAAIGQMVAGLAHESRNAFQRSQACLEMLALELEDRPEALELVARIQKAQEHLHHLYEEVRGYASPIHLQRQVCQLAQVWRDTWAHLERERRQKDVRLTEDLQDVPLTCRADPHALEQLFCNIFENALAACAEPGLIAVRCARSELEGHPAIRVSIQDNGPGFTPDARLQAFEPFFTTRTRGTGLGLPIARRIAEAHGGQIFVGDSPLPGGEIVVILPRG